VPLLLLPLTPSLLLLLTPSLLLNPSLLLLVRLTALLGASHPFCQPSSTCWLQLQLLLRLRHTNPCQVIPRNA
jgi:hypothetical protein